MVAFTRPGGQVAALGNKEARRLHHPYQGPEHLLVGLLLDGDHLAARVLHANGLDLETVRSEVDRLVAQGVLPGPQPGDAELLATIGVDLEAVSSRIEQAFGGDAYWQAAQRVRRRPTQAFTHRMVGGPPLITCRRALKLAAHEATARDQQIGPEHLLLGLLRDAQDPVELDLYPDERRLRGMLGLPDHGPHPIKLLVEARGLILDDLLAAVRSQLDTKR